jgi:hypothetical protein
MSSLIDTMIMGGSKFRGIAIRQIATYASFVLVYFPGWLAVAIVISAAILPKSSNYLPVGFVLLYGLAVTGFSQESPVERPHPGGRHTSRRHPPSGAFQPDEYCLRHTERLIPFRKFDVLHYWHGNVRSSWQTG